MFKNRILLVLSVVSLLLVSMAISSYQSNASPAIREAASDFHQRHPDWTWSADRQNANIPTNEVAAFSDYYQRHPELTRLPGLKRDTSDYFLRHPELIVPAESSVDLTDYYFRHLDL